MPFLLVPALLSSVKFLSLGQDGRRLTIVLPDETPARAAAKAIRGHRFEGRQDAFAVFSYPAAPDVVAILISTFDPTISPSSKEAIEALHQKNASLDAAVSAKDLDDGLFDIFDGCLSTDPMRHQIGAMNFCWSRFAAGAAGAALLMEQGTGKSLVAIGLANALFRAGRIRWGMVIAPNSLKGTWGAEDGEIELHSALETARLIPKGTRTQKADQIGPHLNEDFEDGALPWAILNYEAFALDRHRNRSHALIYSAFADAVKTSPGLLVVDESTMVKNQSAKRTETLTAFADLIPYTLILTGTPVTSSPLDVYAQFDVMEKGSLGFGSMLAFDRTYAIRQARRLGSGQRFSEVVGYRDLEDLEQRVSKLSYRARAADCLDLPDVVIKRIPVGLTPDQAKHLNALRDDMMAELDDGSTIDGRNILTRYLRMAQIIGGAVGVLDDEGRPSDEQYVFVPNPKLDALIDYAELLFEDPEQKAVVFAQYRSEIEAIRDAAREKGWKPVVFYGDVPEGEREAGRRRFKRDPKSRIFIAQYQTGSKGLTLVEAATIMFYSLTFSLEDYLQAKKRVHRIGQTKTVNEVYFLAHVDGRRGPRQTLDHLILGALREKKNVADIVTGDRARQILESAL